MKKTKKKESAVNGTGNSFLASNNVRSLNGRLNVMRSSHSSLRRKKSFNDQNKMFDCDEMFAVFFGQKAGATLANFISELRER